MNRRIAFLAGTLGQGGAEKQLYHLLRTLREGGAALHLLCLTQGEHWESPIRALGIPVTWVGQSGSRLVRLGRIVRTLREIAPDLIQSQHFYTNLYAGLAGRLLGIPSIGAIRNDLFSEMRHTGRLLGPLCLRLPAQLVANSRAALGNARQIGVAARRLALLENAIELPPSAGELAGRVSGPVRIVTAGRLVRQKRFDRWLRIINAVRAATETPFEAQVYGAGPLRQELELMADDLGLHPPQLQFMGLAADPTLIQATADIFVLTSDWEGSPNVILEAMAAGLPVVTSRVGDLEELIVNGRNGFCLAPTDETGMVKAILELIRNQPLRSQLGREARSIIVDRFSPPRYRERVADLYQRFGTDV